MAKQSGEGKTDSELLEEIAQKLEEAGYEISEDRTTITLPNGEKLNIKEYMPVIPSNYPTEGLINYWPLNNSLENKISNNTFGDLIFESNSTDPTYADGGILLDSSNNTFLRSEIGDLSLPDEFTISIDVKILSKVFYPRIFIIANGDLSSCETNNAIALAGNGSDIYMCNGDNRCYGHLSSAKCNIGEWKRIIVTGSTKNSEWNMYIDGEEVDMISGYSKVSGYIGIGTAYPRSYNAGGALLNAYIKNIAIYNKILTQNQLEFINN